MFSIGLSPQHLAIDTDGGAWTADAVVSATGSWANPIFPDVPGRRPPRPSRYWYWMKTGTGSSSTSCLGVISGLSWV